MRSYKRPTMTVERFVPNEYVAACGDENKVYKFKCDAGGWIGQGGNVYLETNGEPGLQIIDRNPDQCLTKGLWNGYTPCGETHEASVNDDFLKGYFLPFGQELFRAVDVMVWRGPNNNNVHVTRNLRQEEWETDKS